ncbi:unnamed protein product [Amoebophrya sp. A25]|nr:unnamed protein product [Amoebophrya sp. A25]|eukprot:GSA25T00008902001.1
MGGACGKSSRSAQAVAPEANKTVEAQPAAKTRLPPAVDVSQNDSSTSPVGPSSPGSGSGIWGFPVPTIVVTPAQNQMGAPPVALSHPRAICRDYRVEPPSDYATEEGIAFQGIEAAAADAPRDINDTLLKKFHSAIRWGKPLSDIAELLDATPALLEARDPGNGNRAIHIAAQNGLSEHTKFFLQRGCKVNAQNNKGT